MMHRFLAHGFVAAALAVATLAVPLTSVHACSCVGFTAADAVEAADLAFVGTVADSTPAGKDPMMGGPLVRYAFEVERASQAVGPFVEVAAHDDGGGASCGFTFGIGERWFVAATMEGGSLRSHLCSGNLRMEDVGDAGMAELVDLLPMEPVAATSGPQTQVSAVAPTATAVGSMVDTPVVVALLIGLAAAAALVVVLFRATKVGRP
ncbi:MAG: hypothetical protein M3406_00055 [Chloroflexota bacterium]|nr:hypothetical protein [Chloroflexota bacterium]